MKADWTSVTPDVALVTLANDAVKHTMRLESLGAHGQEQVDNLAFGAAVFRAMRGNVAGDCVFTAAKSHATRLAAVNFFKAEFARIGQRGTLVLTQDGATLTMANATLRGVTVVLPDGTHWTLRYTFGITTIT